MGFLHVPLDGRSLTAIRDCVHKFSHGFSIRKGATMSFVDSEAKYNTIQDVIRKISSEAGVPPIYFDVLAWDLKA